MQHIKKLWFNVREPVSTVVGAALGFAIGGAALWAFGFVVGVIVLAFGYLFGLAR